MIASAGCSCCRSRCWPRRPPRRPGPRRRPLAALAAIRGVDGLVRVYDVILDARFDQARRRAAPRVRAGAARGLRRARGHGALVAHPARSRQPRARRRVLDVGRARRSQTTEAWTVARTRRRRGVVLSRRRLRRARAVAGAARREARGRARRQAHQGGARTRASRSIPSSTMRTSGSGCTSYYADVAPAAAKILRFLLLLPGGDRREGLAQMLRARTRGRLLQGEADYQLQIIYLWYEQQTPIGRSSCSQSLQRALSRQSALPGADRRDPGRLSARHHGEPRRPGARCSRWRASSASTSRRSPRCRRGWASRGSSTRSRRPIDAIDQLRPRRGAEARRAVRRRSPLAYLRLGEAHDRLDAASATRWRPTAAGDRRHPGRCRRRHRPASASASGMRPPRPGRTRRQRAEAYRLSLEGWRELERNGSAGRRSRARARASRSNPTRPGRAVSLRPRAAGARRRRGGARRSSSWRSATRATRARADRRRRLPRGGAPPRARRRARQAIAATRSRRRSSARRETHAPPRARWHARRDA